MVLDVYLETPLSLLFLDAWKKDLATKHLPQTSANTYSLLHPALKILFGESFCGTWHPLHK